MGKPISTYLSRSSLKANIILCLPCPAVCLAMPHAFNGIMAIFGTAVLFGVSFCLVLANTDMEPLSTNLLGAPHANTAIRAFLIQTSMTVTLTLMQSYPKWLSMLLFLLSTAMFYFYVRWVRRSHIRIAVQLWYLWSFPVREWNKSPFVAQQVKTYDTTRGLKLLVFFAILNSWHSSWTRHHMRFAPIHYFTTKLWEIKMHTTIHDCLMTAATLDVNTKTQAVYVFLQSPHYTFGMNHLKAGLSLQLVWASIMLMGIGKLSSSTLIFRLA